MNYKVKNLGKSQIEFTITVTPNEYRKHMENAALKISERVAIKGFRKGKAPYDLIKKEVGEMQILQEALEKIIQETFYEAVKKEETETVGMPALNIEKVAPGNDVVYTAKVALLPKVKLADLDKIKIERKVKEITDKDIDEVIENLTKMQTKEIIKNGQANKKDKIVIDMNLFLDNIPIEGGQAKDYQVYLSENQHIPGFNDELIGLKKDDEKEFELSFPKNYYNKQLAGNVGKFKIKVKDVYELQFPEINDEFAKTLGQDSLAKMRDLMKKNLEHEAEHKADETAEIEIFETIIEKSTFDEIPEILIDGERKKMFYELTRDLERNGVSVEQYLQDIKKKEEELFEDFKSQATKRAKAALVSRQVAQENNIKVTPEELDKEIKMMQETYKDNDEYKENIKKPEVKESIRNMLANKKVIVFLKDKVLRGKTHKCEEKEEE